MEAKSSRGGNTALTTRTLRFCTAPNVIPRQNDKALVLVDAFVRGIWEEKVMIYVSCNWKENKAQGRIGEEMYNGS